MKNFFLLGHGGASLQSPMIISTGAMLPNPKRLASFQNSEPRLFSLTLNFK